MIPTRALPLWSATLLALALPALAVAEARPLSQCIRERWTYRDGLPHNVAHRLLATRDGYLWIGTQEGLVRFDGVRFKLFSTSTTPNLAGNEVTALLEDERQVLWVGTASGLSRLEGDRFEAVALGRDTAVTDLTHDGEGGVWVATEASGVRHVAAGGQARPEPVVGLPDPRVLALTWVGRELWAGGVGGLARLKEGRAERIELPGLPQAPVTRILPARDGTLWIGTGAGLWRRRPGERGLSPVPAVGAWSVEALLEDRTGAIWVGLEGRPLVRLQDDLVQPLPGVGSPGDAHALAEDLDGDLWIGTETGGLHRIRWGAATTVASEEGLATDVVWTLREGRGGVLWVASDAGLDRVEGDVVTHAHVAELHGVTLGGLLEDRAGALWVGTGDGLARFDARGARRFRKADGLGGTLSRALLEDRAGTIWVGSSHGLFRQRGERFELVASDPSMGSDKVNVIEEGADGTIWAGTTSGLARVDGDRLVPAFAAGAPVRGDVTALRADPGGDLWVGTVGEGLIRLVGGRLDRWTQREGLFEDTVLAILDDGAGQLWLAGSHGISRVVRNDLVAVAAGRRAALAPTVLGTADGMRERECNGGVTPAAWRASDGRLWFATIRGAVAVNPERVVTSAPPPPARVEELVADGHAIPVDGGPLRLPAGVRRVELRYTGLALAAADRIRFRHRLKGLDDAFLEVGGERVAHFTHLGPGRYQFEVVAATASGDWGTPAVVTLEVASYPWQTGWFAAAVAALVAALVAGFIRLRTAGLRRRQAELTALVEEEMQKVKLLTGLLPTCAWCKKIKDEQGEWQQFEAYVSRRTDAQFSHGMCPDCFGRYHEAEKD